MVSCRLTGTCTTALRGLVKRGESAARLSRWPSREFVTD